MSQKEIIYLSFGSFSNHISTHFWNQQQSYFTYDDSDPTAVPSGSLNRDQDAREDDEPLIDHDISFRAGQTLTGQDTYSPRAILFESEQEFGALSKLNALYDSFSETQQGRNVALDSLQSWGREAHLVAAEKVRKSSYQRRLELEDQGLDPGSSADEDDDADNDIGQPTGDKSESALTNNASGMGRMRKTKRPYRFWSDYSRTYFHSKSLVSVGGQLTAPMPGSFNATPTAGGSDGRIHFQTFSQGAAQFDELEAQQEVLDTIVRWFAEDADLLQGFQYSIDTSDAFGGLGAAYLENLVDEFPKTSHLVFGAGWGNTEVVKEEEGGDNAATENRLARIRRMNRLLSLVEFMEFSTVLAPIQVPQWESDAQLGKHWRRYVGRVDLSDMHHAAALVSAHLETATLGTRLRSRHETLASLTSRLNWRRDTKLVHLGGTVPLPYPAALSSASFGPPANMDLVDALLQSYSYGSQDARARQRGAPLESESDLAARGAKLVLSSWLDFSLPSSSIVSSRGAKQRKKLFYNLCHPFSHTAILRNTNLEDARLGFGMLDNMLSAIREPFGQGIFIPQSYNILSSFPNFFTNLDTDSKPITAPSHIWDNAKVVRPKQIPMLSSLAVTPNSVLLLQEARKTVSEALNGHAPLAEFGLDSGVEARDTLKEVREKIEEWIDTYSVNDDGGSDIGDNDGMGTDEEYDVDQKVDDGLDWDM